MEIIKTIDSKEGMKCILNGIQSFNANKFLWACNKSNFSVEDIDSMTNYVCSYLEKLEVEFDRLQRFGKNFTNRYSTEDNMFFIITKELYMAHMCDFAIDHDPVNSGIGLAF